MNSHRCRKSRVSPCQTFHRTQLLQVEDLAVPNKLPSLFFKKILFSLDDIDSQIPTLFKGAPSRLKGSTSQKLPSCLQGWSMTWLRATSANQSTGSSKGCAALPQSCPVLHKFPWNTLAVAVPEWLIAAPVHAQSQWPKDRSIPPHHALPSSSCNRCAVSHRRKQAFPPTSPSNQEYNYK